MSILERLTRGVVERNVVKEGAALLSKWSKTGLLEGLAGDYEKQSMAVLLENQAKELLREANTQGSDGNVQGFAAVAFPLVRRVFGGLLANDLVSVQPMSLPSGLIFFLDFTKSSDRDNTKGDSIHGQGVVGSGIIRGVELGENGFYHLSQGYSSARGSVKVAAIAASVDSGPGARPAFSGALTLGHYFNLSNALVESEAEKVDFDPDLLSDAAAVGGSTDWLAICTLDLVALKDLGASSNANSRLLAQSSADCEVTPDKNLVAQMTPHHVMTLALSKNAIPGLSLVRRLTKVTEVDDATGAPKKIRLVLRAAETVLYSSISATALFDNNTVGIKNKNSFDITFAIGDLVTEVAGGLGTLEPYGTWEFESTLANPFGANGDPADGLNIPEIDIKVDSTAITATTRKMKAKWTPELGQDLNAYHNLDAEVELTQVLSEQIALEIDQEILKDLITQATAGKFYWSRVPGRFVNRVSGAEINSGDFTGTVSQWYETLVETINDVSAQIHRKTLRGGANFLVCGPEVANILEFTNGFRASVTHSDEKGTVGATKEGSINKKFDLYVDPYFPRNVILVGRKGSSFLESGYVYAPYVPLQTTPTIFGTEDFTPRKGVMTRYGKKMVRPDMYGLVLVRDMNVITSVA
jgi:hypothetical protein